MTYRIPDWLKDGFEALHVYADGGDVWFRVTKENGKLLVWTRIGDSDEWRELFPDDEEPDWEDMPLVEWMKYYYGELFLDVTKEPRSQRILRKPSRYLGEEEVAFKSKYYTCLKLKNEYEQDCGCKDMSKMRLLMRPGKCWDCGGILPGLRKCKECGGTGLCNTCHGKGKYLAEDFFWYEKRTGILLKGERYIEGEMVNNQYLEFLKPDILAMVG